MQHIYEDRHFRLMNSHYTRQLPVELCIIRRQNQSCIATAFFCRLVLRRQGLTTVSHEVLRSVVQHIRMWDENFMVQVQCVLKKNCSDEVSTCYSIVTVNVTDD